MDKGLDRVRNEPSQIHDQLFSLPADEFDGRARLEDRQNGLRRLSHELIGGEPRYSREIFHQVRSSR